MPGPDSGFQPVTDESTVVVIGFAEALAAPEVLWSLVDAGYTVVAFSRNSVPAALTVSRCTRVHKIPAPESDLAASEAALRGLLEQVRRDGRYRRYVLLAMDDAALLLCCRVGPESGWKVAGPGTDAALDLAINKQTQVETARAAGFDVPDTTVVMQRSELADLQIPFPVIIRPALAVGVSGNRLRKGRNWICSDAQELEGASDQWDGQIPLLVQSYLNGVGEGIFGLATGTGVFAWSAHRRLRMMNPHGSGASACESRLVDEAVKRPVERFLASVGWTGMFMIEMLRCPTGRLTFVEFNGRAWGSMALARRQGLEYPAWSVQLALGEERGRAGVASQVRAGRICRNLGRELMHILFVARGPRSTAIHGWPSLAKTLLDMLRWPAGTSVYNWRANDWKVFVADTYLTLVRNLRKSGEA